LDSVAASAVSSTLRLSAATFDPSVSTFSRVFITFSSSHSVWMKLWIRKTVKTVRRISFSAARIGFCMAS
jgi:hypothetical protein